MRLALAQLNPLVGDLAGNGARLLAACREAQAGSPDGSPGGADLVLSPELSLWGYPPRDLLLSPARLETQRRVLDQLAADLAGLNPALALLVGIAEPSGERQRPALFNALALVQGGSWRVVARKQLLPSYDVFDERRYFRPGEGSAVLELPGPDRPWRLGLTICEDLWVEEELQGHRLAGPDPVADLRTSRVDLLLNLSASPFGQAKVALRHRLAARAARRLACPVVYVNQVGGNDELVFDGASFVVDAAGVLVCQLDCCREQVALWNAEPGGAVPGSGPGSLAPAPGSETAPQLTPHRQASTTHHPGSAPNRPTHPSGPSAPLSPEPEQLLRALVLGVADYARKCGFRRALLGLSGGIDSALVAVIAAAALGPEHVQALLMPSPWSSAGSIHDAEALAGRLGLATHTLAIADLMAGFDAALTPALGQPPTGVTAENLQSRIRGNLLMAVANAQGGLLLSTGNKSELAVGYCTLYGDMNGGLAVIGDLYKSSVFALCDWLDSPASAGCRRELGLPASGELVGAAIRTKAPSAELRPDQRDSDSLPDYALLDPLLMALVEEQRSPEELIQAGHDPALVERIAGLVRRAEFKRRQAAPVLKVSGRAFGSGWRMPIAAG